MFVAFFGGTPPRKKEKENTPGNFREFQLFILLCGVLHTRPRNGLCIGFGVMKDHTRRQPFLGCDGTPDVFVVVILSGDLLFLSIWESIYTYVCMYISFPVTVDDDG